MSGEEESKGGPAGAGPGGTGAETGLAGEVTPVSSARGEHRHPPAPGARSERPEHASIRVVMMPKDTNALGTIFGGIILSYLDLAGAIEAHHHVRGKLVTVSMREVEFLAPVFVGDLVTFYTETVRIGRTSITVRVLVEAERRFGSADGSFQVTEAEVVYVHVDDDRKPVPIAQDPP